MNIVFRVDSSNFIGTGHLYRCLHLANCFRENNIYFICKKHPYNLNQKATEYNLIEIENGNDIEINLDIQTWLGENEIKDADKVIKVLKEIDINVDWLIVDHYAISSKWENKLRDFAKKILVIDDFTTRNHNCDVILNQQISERVGNNEYKKVVPEDCRICCGNDYLILNKEYFKYKNITKKHNKILSNIVIFMGGADTLNTTQPILETCIEFNKKIKHPKIILDVIIGRANKNYKLFKRYEEKYEFVKIHYDIPFIGDLLFKCDLSIGAIGTTCYERCVTLTPSLCVCVAENQMTILDKFIKAGVMKYLGTINDNYLEKLNNILELVIENTNELKIMSEKCGEFVNIRNNKTYSLLS